MARKQKTTDTMRAAKQAVDRAAVVEDAAYEQQGHLSLRQQKRSTSEAVSRFLRGR
jgi:hypothetical protein